MKEMKTKPMGMEDMETMGRRTGYDDAMRMIKGMDSDGIHPDFDRGYERGYAEARNMMTGR